VGWAARTEYFEKVLPQCDTRLKRTQSLAERASASSEDIHIIPLRDVRSEDVALWQVWAKYMSLVDIEAVGQAYTGMCDKMKQDKSNRTCS
jgi:hypothetical protein